MPHVEPVLRHPSHEMLRPPEDVAVFQTLLSSIVDQRTGNLLLKDVQAWTQSVLPWANSMLCT